MLLRIEFVGFQFENLLRITNEKSKDYKEIKSPNCCETRKAP